MPTMQDLCNRARLPLNDADQARYSDDLLLGFANTAIRRAYEARPDLRHGHHATAFEDLDLDDDFPLPARLLQPCADYASGRASTIDDEDGNATRAAAFMQLFETHLM